MAGNIVKWWKHKILGGYKQFSVLQECTTDSEELMYPLRAPSSCSAPPDLLLVSDRENVSIKSPLNIVSSSKTHATQQSQQQHQQSQQQQQQQHQQQHHHHYHHQQQLPTHHKHLQSKDLHSTQSKQQNQQSTSSSTNVPVSGKGHQGNGSSGGTVTVTGVEHQKVDDQQRVRLEEFTCDVSVEGGKSTQPLQFSFTFYDLDGHHGKITKDDIVGIVYTIYESIGKSVVVPHCGSKTINVRLTVSPENKSKSNEKTKKSTQQQQQQQQKQQQISQQHSRRQHRYRRKLIKSDDEEDEADSCSDKEIFSSNNRKSSSSGNKFNKLLSNGTGVNLSSCTNNQKIYCPDIKLDHYSTGNCNQSHSANQVPQQQQQQQQSSNSKYVSPAENIYESMANLKYNNLSAKFLDLSLSRKPAAMVATTTSVMDSENINCREKNSTAHNNGSNNSSNNNNNSFTMTGGVPIVSNVSTSYPYHQEQQQQQQYLKQVSAKAKILRKARKQKYQEQCCEYRQRSLSVGNESSWKYNRSNIRNDGDENFLLTNINNGNNNNDNNKGREDTVDSGHPTARNPSNLCDDVTGTGGISSSTAECWNNALKRNDLIDIIRESMEKNRLCFQSNGKTHQNIKPTRHRQRSNTVSKLQDVNYSPRQIIKPSHIPTFHQQQLSPQQRQQISSNRGVALHSKTNLCGYDSFLHATICSAIMNDNQQQQQQHFQQDQQQIYTSPKIYGSNVVKSSKLLSISSNHNNNNNNNINYNNSNGNGNQLNNNKNCAQFHGYQRLNSSYSSVLNQEQHHDHHHYHHHINNKVANNNIQMNEEKFTRTIDHVEKWLNEHECHQRNLHKGNDPLKILKTIGDEEKLKKDYKNYDSLLCSKLTEKLSEIPRKLSHENYTSNNNNNSSENSDDNKSKMNGDKANSSRNSKIPYSPNDCRKIFQKLNRYDDQESHLKLSPIKNIEGNNKGKDFNGKNITGTNRTNIFQQNTGNSTGGAANDNSNMDKFSSLIPLEIIDPTECENLIHPTSDEDNTMQSSKSTSSKTTIGKSIDNHRIKEQVDKQIPVHTSKYSGSDSSSSSKSKTKISGTKKSGILMQKRIYNVNGKNDSVNNDINIRECHEDDSKTTPKSIKEDIVKIRSGKIMDKKNKSNENCDVVPSPSSMVHRYVHEHIHHHYHHFEDKKN